MRVTIAVGGGMGLGLMLLAAGCSTPVKTEFKSGTDFSRYRTFALLPLKQQASTTDPGAALRLAEPAREAVTGALTAKGLFTAPLEQADLAVNLRGQSLPKVETTSYGYSYPMMAGYGRGGVYYAPYSTVSTTIERTLIVELFDSHAKELVWVGWLKKNSQAQVSAKTVQEAIHTILAEYPPKTPDTAKTP